MRHIAIVVERLLQHATGNPRSTRRGAKKAVDEFVAANGKQYWAMHLLTGQAVLTRLA